MFGLGRRKDEQDYDEVYVYEDEYDDEYEDEYDEYDDDDEDEYDDEYEDEDDDNYDDPPRYSRKKKESRGKKRRSRDESTITHKEEEELRYEINHLEETVQHLTEQLEVKQGELYSVSNMLAEKERYADAAVNELRRELEADISQVRSESEALLREYKNRIELLEDELADRKQQVRSRANEVDSVKQSYEQRIVEQERRIHDLQNRTQHQEALKSDLANIIIETKEQQKEVITRAQWEGEQLRESAEEEANKILSEAAAELHLIKQEAERHRDWLGEMQVESNLLFDKLIASTERLTKQEIRGGNFIGEGKRNSSDHLPDISPVNRRASL